MNSSLNDSNNNSNNYQNKNEPYQIQSPLNTGYLRSQILQIFPNYLDPDCKEERIQQCQNTIKEIKALLQEHESNADENGQIQNCKNIISKQSKQIKKRSRDIKMNRECIIKQGNQEYMLKAVAFIKEKLRIAIFQTPYPECFTMFEEFYNERYADDLVEHQVSEFFSLKEIPSIQNLGYYLFNNEKVCDKEGHGTEKPEEQKENEQKQQLIYWPVIQNNVTNEEFRQVLSEIYNNNGGRIPHLERLLCWFPDFLCKYHNLTTEIFLQPGPIPIEQRYFIAILASSNFGCEYLHSRLSQQFLNIGGDIKWLEIGLEQIDNPKLQALASFNSKLAYAPSEVCKHQAMIQDMIDIGWQKNELVQAVFIITFYHGLASACQALGLKSELDLKNSHFSLLSKTQTPIGSNMQSPKNKSEEKNQKVQTFEFANNEIENLLKRMTLSEGEFNANEDESNQPEKQQQQAEKFHQSKKKTSSLTFKERDDVSSPVIKDPQSQSMLVSSTSENETKILQMRLFEKFKKFISNPEFRDKDERISQTLRYSEFNYSTHGNQIAGQYTYELTSAMKDVLDIIKTMTNKNFNSSQNLSTTPFRKAIKLYIQNIFGYTHFDADYKTEMNALLPIPLKTVLKLTVKRPFEIQLNHISKINLKLQPSEVAHIILIAVHARIEIELVYFLFPFQKF